MNLFTHLLAGARALVVRRDFEQEAIELADQLEDEAWNLIHRRARSLSRHEARGYLRARITLLLSGALQRQNLSHTTAELLRGLTLAELTDRLQARLIYTPTQVRMRAAA